MGIVILTQDPTMGWYQRLIVPRLIDLAMRNRSLDAYRQRTIGAASGLVLEVGVGSGQNLPRYGPQVDRVYAIDPSLELLRSARNKIASTAMPASLIGASAEELPFANTIFDTVVTSWTLCSIPDPVQAPVEMRRVLKPGGKLVFVEHGLSPEARVARWQHRLTPSWRRFAGGCHLDRKMDDLILAGGFRLNHLETGYVDGPKVMTFMYQGQASS